MALPDSCSILAGSYAKLGVIVTLRFTGVIFTGIHTSLWGCVCHQSDRTAGRLLFADVGAVLVGSRWLPYVVTWALLMWRCRTPKGWARAPPKEYLSRSSKGMIRFHGWIKFTWREAFIWLEPRLGLENLSDHSCRRDVRAPVWGSPAFSKLSSWDEMNNCPTLITDELSRTACYWAMSRSTVLPRQTLVYHGHIMIPRIEWTLIILWCPQARYVGKRDAHGSRSSLRQAGTSRVHHETHPYYPWHQVYFTGGFR